MACVLCVNICISFGYTNNCGFKLELEKNNEMSMSHFDTQGMANSAAFYMSPIINMNLDR